MDMANASSRRGLVAALGLLAGGAAIGAVLAGTLSAGAASPSPTPSSSTSERGGPGVQENDGIPESQEHHGGHGGHALDLTGTVASVGTGTLAITTTSGKTTYTVDSASDIDKNGESQLSSLVVGETVHYSVRNGTKTIDKLHAGDETKNRPADPPAATPGG
jgi:hypothetical protein